MVRCHAGVAKLADATDSKSVAGNCVPVRVRPPASGSEEFLFAVLFLCLTSVSVKFAKCVLPLWANAVKTCIIKSDFFQMMMNRYSRSGPHCF